MTAYHSAQHFIRALKAPSDPPVADGPLKIAIAEQAWHDQSFHLPNKAEVVADFLLSKFFRERAEGTVLGSERYWKLLSEVLTSSSNGLAWLRPMLGRVPVVPIVLSFLNLWNQLDPSQSMQLLVHASYCISILYPLGTQKTTTEVLLDAWGTFLKNSRYFFDDVSAVKIGAVLTGVYGDSLSNSSSRKKVSNNLVQNAEFFNPWLALLSSVSSYPQGDYLQKLALSVGVETIFNQDTLRPLSESPEASPLFIALDHALRSNRDAVLNALPRLFEHYVASLKKNRAVISTSGSSSQAGSSRAELNAAAMRFYASLQTMLDRERRDIASWNSISTLTAFVAQEGLYDSTSDPALTLQKNVTLALEYMLDSEQANLPRAIVRCLSATIRVDYDLVLPFMGQIFSRLLAIPQAHTDHFAFLDLLLGYHTKTRTVNVYIETLLSCLRLDDTRSLFPADERYAVCHSSPILHPRHLERLHKATEQFLTPSQYDNTVELVCEALKSLKEKHKSAEKQREAESGRESRKKRKSDAMPVDQPDADSLAVAFSLTSKLCETFFGSLSLSSVPQQQAEQVRGVVATFRAEFLEHALPKLLKSVARNDQDEEHKAKTSKRKSPSGESSYSWGTQVVTISFLRLRYALGMSRSLSLPPVTAPKLPKRLLTIVAQNEDGLLPELALEIFRALLDQAATMDKIEALHAIGHALRFVDSRLSPNLCVAWSGHPHDLTREEGRPGAGLAVLHLLLERWLPVIDITASEEQLQHLAKLITRTPLTLTLHLSSRNEALSADQLVFRSLRSAQFWEQRNLRTALLSSLVDATSTLDEATTESPSSKKYQKRKEDISRDAAEVLSTYRLLLFFPIEYFAKSCRADLIKRAVSADWRLSKQLDTGAGHALDGLSVIRTYLKRTFLFLGAIEQQSLHDVANFTLHLLQDTPLVGDKPDYVQTTLELCEMYFAELFRQTMRGSSAEACEVLNSYLQAPGFQNLESVKAKSLVSLIELLKKDFTFASFSSELQSSLQDVHSRLTAMLQEKLDAVLQTSEPEALAQVPALLTYWHALLDLGQWIGLANAKLYGRNLVRKFNAQFLSKRDEMAAGWADRTGATIVAILLAELHCRDGMECNDTLDIVLASYISYRRILSESGKVGLDDFVSKACRQLSPANFEYVLGLLDEALSRPSPIANILVHLATVLLGNHPQNTLRIMQAFFTCCLDIFTSDNAFTTGPNDLRIHMLDFLAEHASERPAALRSLDMGSIWSLLSKCLSPSTLHDEVTSPSVFHKIIAVVSAIIRLRRDLATPMLPHLGMVLRQLILCMRHSRPQLASKQCDMVMSTQPRWINARHSLGVEEAKALSRVLETLTTKTITRMHATSSEMQKAESLATPFSKHAAFVLKAYIEAMNDPLCVLPLDIRKELSPGLYALCSMVGEHSRDAMMVSALDASGKATLKALWREYEKQRYVGRG